MKTIKNYKLFKESLLDYLKGPTIEEILNIDPTKVLEIGVLENNINYVKLAIQNGADVKYKDNKFLEIASNSNYYGEYTDIIKYLIENGADIMSNFNNAFYKACEYHQYELADYLVKRGSDPNFEKEHAFIFAAQGGDIETLKYLKKFNPDVHSLDDQAFKIAIEYDRLNVVKYLNESYNFKSEFCDVYHFFIIAIQNERSEILEYLLENGFSLERLDNDYKESVIHNHPSYNIRNILKKYMNDN